MIIDIKYMTYSKTSIIIAAALCGMSVKVYDDLDDNRDFFLNLAREKDLTWMFYYLLETGRILTWISVTYVSIFHLQFLWCLLFMCMVQYFGKYIQKLFHSADHQDDKLEVGEGFDKAYEKSGFLLGILQACLFQVFGLSHDTGVGISLDAFIATAAIIMTKIRSRTFIGDPEYSESKLYIRALWGGVVLPCFLLANNYVWPYLFGYKGGNVGWEALCVMGIAYMLTSCLFQWILLKNDKSVEDHKDEEESGDVKSETDEPQEV